MTEYIATYLDCGHTVVKPTNHTGAAGWATWLDCGERRCNDCTDAGIRQELADPATSRLVAYLAQNGHQVTTWTGGTLARVTESHSGARRWPPHAGAPFRITYWQAIAPDGSRWYGKCGGRGMVTTMHRAKESS